MTSLTLSLLILLLPGALPLLQPTELYRESVALAPRHLPTLASSLQNRASILWNIDRQDKAITVGILRKVVVPETYFLPTLAEALDQLAGSFTQKGDVIAASAALAECAEVRRRFACLPLQPEFLFEKVKMEWNDEDDEEEEAKEGWETASEGDDQKYHDASDIATDVEGMLSETEPEQPINLESLPLSTSLAPALEQNHTDAAVPTAIPAKSPLTGLLSMPLEVRLNMNMNMDMRMSMRSTPVDILWWLLIGMLFAALAWSRLV